MCELLGMSANVPTDICFSFTGLMQRGGRTGPHKDGWGIVLYEGKAIREFRDSQPSYQSAVAELVKQYPIKSCIVISHIRQANSGRVCLENTHPFIRELWGRKWTFAHNGQLKKAKQALPLSFYLPVGTTDSEHAFCWMLAQIRQQFPVMPEQPEPIWQAIHQLCCQLNEYGVFNLLLSEANYLYAFCSTKLSWLTRRAPFAEAILKDAELKIDFQKETTPNDVVTVIATEPLTTNETWNTLEPGELAVFQLGELVSTIKAKE
ncbi:class II glutamine amidotransferase [Endozoicomonas sp. SM1973]|uniref:Class II glutamine amidotransferase n=1 Tax=Spartinivicinus marinus TaxID=2994442 RepID=A0A853I7J3_9GAMM|nr:class II glutamine amidotransferase [Spartinivicinus marinus]MCX4029211.1 class II glutamine amidotransferase [Spartinivicinus marinus]NYZ65881.1 class II glutamine amidotransferase [Spartinivicinus marinus]